MLGENLQEIALSLSVVDHVEVRALDIHDLGTQALPFGRREPFLTCQGGMAVTSRPEPIEERRKSIQGIITQEVCPPSTLVLDQQSPGDRVAEVVANQVVPTCGRSPRVLAQKRLNKLRLSQSPGQKGSLAVTSPKSSGDRPFANRFSTEGAKTDHWYFFHEATS